LTVLIDILKPEKLVKLTVRQGKLFQALQEKIDKPTLLSSV